MLERSCYILYMNKLSQEKQIQIIQALVEGNSIRSTSRMTGAAQGTILTLLQRVGEACEAYQAEHLRGLTCRRIQCDEIWSYCHSKEKNVPKEHKGEAGFGDVYTWTALDADNRLMVSWVVGKRSPAHADAFIADLKSRIVNRPQITTDGYAPYFTAVEKAFGENVDFAIIRKSYGTDAYPKGRYSPAYVVGAKKENVVGYPIKAHISTSYVERQNLTMRMSMRRFTRLTNAFSKKIEKLQAAVALHFMYYNYVRVHKTLGSTPAMAAGLTTKIWAISDLIDFIDKSN